MTAHSTTPQTYFSDLSHHSALDRSLRKALNASIRVALIEDCPLFRRGISQALAAEPDFDLVDEGEKIGDGIRIAYEKKPDLIILSHCGVETELDAIPVIHSASPGARVVVITAATDADHARAAFLAGARGYLSKSVTRGELLDALRRVAEQPVIVTQGLTPAQISSGQLSPREQQILDKIAEGRSNKEIARCLNITEKTVKQHITSLLSKLGVRNRVEAAVLACNDAGNVDPTMTGPK
jgi:DNA-binding NarL/FixJ family response regulator